MARSRKGMLNSLVELPWQVGAITGVAFFVVITWVLPWWFARQDGMVFKGLANASGNLSFFAWFLLLACWGAATVSWLRARRARRLLDTRSDLESLAAPGWRQFEHLVGEAFRRQGYKVEATGLGADGGIDLILHRHGERILVQCKQWRKQRVDVKTVREMFGLLAHHNADAVKIVALGRFTAEAERFAAGKPIELVDGETLLAMIRAVQDTPSPSAAPVQPTPAARKPRTTPIAPGVAAASTTTGAPDSATPPCPRCGQATIQRRNRQTGQPFFGCSGFPQCRGTIQAG